MDRGKDFMRVVFAIVSLLMAMLLAHEAVLADNLIKRKPAPKTDTIRRVTVRVIARERPTNYDSIFHAQPTGVARTAANTKRSAVSVPKRVNKSSAGRYPKRLTTDRPSRKPENTGAFTQKRTAVESAPQKQAPKPAKKPSLPPSKTLLAASTGSVGSTQVNEEKTAANNLFAEAGEPEQLQADVPSGPVETPVKTEPAVREPQRAGIADSALPDDSDLTAIANSRVNDFSIENSPKANKISYMWIGFVLLLAGVVLGLVFGRTAFMISAVGVVFLIIGFMI
ncbi:MAG TPA: hypothetical protein VGE26_07675 [Sphingobacteriaceae bacterium]